ncbi:MAG: hypothetical protein ABH806_02380 [Candidatus Omnitrophota bacterium]
MAILVKLLGIIILALGVVFLINPDMVKKYMLFWTKGRMIYAGAAVAALIGMVLLIAASQCRLAWFVSLMGIVSIIKGAYIFAFGQKSLTSMMNWWIEKPTLALRFVGLFELMLGALFIYAA